MRLNYFFILVSITLFMGCADDTNNSEGDKGMSLSREEKLKIISDVGDSEGANNAEKIAVYLNDEDLRVASSACFYLGYLNSRNYLAEMIKLLESTDQDVLNSCTLGLSLIVDERDSSLLDRLYQLLEHESLLVRMSSIQAIGNIRHNASSALLQKRFDIEEPAAKLEIIVALGKVGNTESLPLLRSYQKTVDAMDHSIPRKGGVRGSEPHPDVLDLAVTEAINALEN
jgi:hypothetical protein